MEVVNFGNTYQLYDESLKTFSQLPAQSYIVRFNKMTGFFLEKYDDITINEKVYGVHHEKVEKVLNSFAAFERNLGVILSGRKGIGKSLFAKLLSNEAVNRNLPLIIVDTYIPGIASFLEEIHQEVVILFDEFDKTFGGVKAEDGQADPQVGLLTLFDGISQGKKLFVVTCNEIKKLNEYLVNRPGRFHYHFRFECPSPEEIREYLQDKLSEGQYREIDEVITFSRKVNLNYDCLRAIAFELNSGLTFAEAIKDLNIINIDSVTYNVNMHFKNGEVLKNAYGKQSYDLFSAIDENVWVNTNKGEYIANIHFNTGDVTFDSSKGIPVIKGSDLEIHFEDDFDSEHHKALIDHYRALEPDFLSFTRVRDKSYHYMV